MTPESFLSAIRRVATVYHDKQIWRHLKKNGMTRDFSWRSSAAAYCKIYLSLVS
jgi:starch synthase